MDEKLCEEMQRVGNLSLSLSLEGFSEVNDLRRGEGVFARVMHAMDLLKEYGLIFGTSICYTRNNVEVVTSDEFLDMIIEKGCRFTWYFHLMPVGNNAAPELMPTKEQREYMYRRVREIRGFTGGKQIFAMDFQNDGEFVGGCIAGGRNYFHINANGDAEPCVLSIIPAPTFMKILCWNVCGSPCLWPTETGSPSMRTTCVPAPCWKILRYCSRWCMRPGRSPRIWSPRRRWSICAASAKSTRKPGSPARMSCGAKPSTGNTAMRTTKTGSRRKNDDGRMAGYCR